jgi:hypothetical protein
MANEFDYLTRIGKNTDKTKSKISALCALSVFKRHMTNACRMQMLFDLTSPIGVNPQ